MSVTPQDLIDNSWAQLHAVSEADAVWWTQNELARYCANELKRLAETYGCFVSRDTTSVVLADTQSIYDAPPRHCSTLHIAVDNRPLRASSTTELERRDRQYQTRAATSSTPVRYFYEDRRGVNKIGFVPVPYAGNVGQTVEVIFHQFVCLDPADIADPITMPKVYGDMIEMLVVAEAYDREGDAHCPEIAQGYRSIADLIKQASEPIYGVAQ